ncbi:hypothetical protein E2C01_026339 [Portunus trituberculatus]|uniref:Uncharacterized protein n=1 Tax=Portunus trituberculatus TaxID=210409 RepID=A0A5B7EFE7_PORTR|nr:hypothetical protein [Portunus trituberculatus]
MGEAEQVQCQVTNVCRQQGGKNFCSKCALHLLVLTSAGLELKSHSLICRTLPSDKREDSRHEEGKRSPKQPLQPPVTPLGQLLHPLLGITLQQHRQEGHTVLCKEGICCVEAKRSAGEGCDVVTMLQPLGCQVLEVCGQEVLWCGALGCADAKKMEGQEDM